MKTKEELQTILSRIKADGGARIRCTTTGEMEKVNRVPCDEPMRDYYRCLGCGEYLTVRDVAERA